MYLVIVLLAFSMLAMFYINQESIASNGQIQLFMILATVAAGFLVGLLYLLSRPHEKTATVKRVVKAKKVKSTKKRK